MFSWLLLSCAILTPKEVEALLDLDGDGFVGVERGGDDCWDDPSAIPDAFQALVGTLQPSAADVHPGATETWYDGVDGDCTGGSDFDQDGDQHDARAADVPGAAGDDCDDADAAIHPTATDAPYDGIDSDCFGDSDYDQDRDGHDALGSDVPGASGDDCDDANPDVSPELPERCSTPDDDDCDGSINEPNAADCTDWYADADGDGHGTGEATCLCEASSPYTASLADDCDDTAPTVNPDEAELCATGGVDDNCDGIADEPDAADCTVYYQDEDGDDIGTDVSACLCASASPFTATETGDCDDGEPRIHPGSPELCATGFDDNCDASDLDADGCIAVYGDADGDSYGAGPTECHCATTDSFSATRGDDCDDARPDVHPDATETCADPADEDCDGVANPPDSAGCVPFYASADGDAWGGADSACLCAADGTYTALVTGDCDDTDAAINPGAAETCATSVDDDCDGSRNDPGAVGCTTYATDGDGDSYGVEPSACLCAPEGDLVATSTTDCDDGDARVHPGTREICDGLDDDCDATTTDDDLVTVFDGTSFTNVGWSTDPDTVTTWTATHDADIAICRTSTGGPYYVNVANGGASLTLTGDASDPPTLDGGGVGPVLRFIDGASTVSYLHIRNGGGFLGGSNVYGGNVYVSTDNDNSAVELTLTACEIADCAAGVTHGGGVAVRNQADVVLESVYMVGNAADRGGGLYIPGSASVVMIDSAITANVATEGAGVFLEGELDCEGGGGDWGIFGNSATAYGGGVYIPNTTTGTALTSTMCDFGGGTSALADNTAGSASDVTIQRTSSTLVTYDTYDTDATFTCSSGSGAVCSP